MELVLRQNLKEYIEQLINSKAAGSYLFIGPESTGKFTAAKHIAANLASGKAEINHKLMEANAHPDIHIIDEERSIGIGIIQELEQKLSLRSQYKEGQKITVVNNAHIMTSQAQNAFLKTLEEPPAGSMIILVSSRLNNLLPTIRSRVQLVRFNKLPDSEVEQNLTKLYPQKSTIIASLADGSIGRALRLAGDEEYLKQQTLVDETAQRILNEGLYEKLRLGAKILSEEISIEDFSMAIVRAAKRQFERIESLQQAMDSVRIFLEQAHQNVNMKLAINNLMLNLEKC